MPEPITTPMKLALEQAAHGIRGANPLVGAVITDYDGTILAAGYHKGAGTPHAEVDALSQLSHDISPENLHMYVTLEPCNHTGRTGPCSEAIVNSGIKRVSIAVLDPTDQASGGRKTLETAGITVDVGILKEEAYELNERWFIAQKQNRPFVTAKFAQTLDGKIAALDGSSQWITGEKAREDTHQDRERVDGIIVGTGTVLSDNPSLTARNHDKLADHQPMPIVLGKTDIPENAKIKEHPSGKLYHGTSHNVLKELQNLKQQGCDHVLVEGGATVLAEFFKADCVDNIIVYIAPKLLGEGKSVLAPLGINSIDQALELKYDPISTPTLCGEDVKLQLIPRRKS